MIFAFGASTEEDSTSASALDSLLDVVPVSSSYSHFPRRWPSSFQKKSPIIVGAARRRSCTSTTQGSINDDSSACAFVADETLHVPRRWPSSFFKKSPIRYSDRRGARTVLIPQATNFASHHEEEKNLVHATLANHSQEINDLEISDFPNPTRPAAQERVAAAYYHHYSHSPEQHNPVVAMARRSNKHETVADDGNPPGGSNSKAEYLTRKQRTNVTKFEDLPTQGLTQGEGVKESSSSAVPFPMESQPSQAKTTTPETNDQRKVTSAPKAKSTATESSQQKFSSGRKGKPQESVGSNKTAPPVEISRPLRPLSMFRKRSPIPPSAKERKLRALTGSTPTEADSLTSKILQGKSKSASREKSRFVKQSPVPSQRRNAVSNEVKARPEVTSIAEGTERPAIVSGSQVFSTDDEAVSSGTVLPELTPQDRSFVVEAGRDADLPAGSKQATVSGGARVPGSGVIPVIEVPAEVIVQDGSFVVETERKVFIEDATRSATQASVFGSSGSLLGDELELDKSAKVKDLQEAGNSEESKVVSLDDLESYKLVELKNIAKSWGLKGYSKLKKVELIDLVRASKKQKEE